MEFHIELGSGWNFVSLPFAPRDLDVDAVFADARVLQVWRWDAEGRRYRSVQRVEPGVGYWVWCAAPESREDDAGVILRVEGRAARAPRHTVHRGWNAGGCISADGTTPLPLPATLLAPRRRTPSCLV